MKIKLNSKQLEQIHNRIMVINCKLDRKNFCEIYGTKAKHYLQEEKEFLTKCTESGFINLKYQYEQIN